ncbi:hypothetical protein DXG03_009123 [Asterophora parasitica]|uniref:EthD domain-containing protein n=1 Tax=Asterophora parasitica TaxID=117018 RepID=A0A9P7G722_9AGAR|nr:hypothetical protein DXG03_009123 [Asterophora parasitica]
MSIQGRVRLFYFLKRKPDISREEFFHYWTEVVAPIYNSLDIVKRYNITNQPALAKDTVVGAHASGFASSDWDGVGTLEGDSFEQIFETLANDEYKALVEAEEPNYLDSIKFLPLNVIAVTE